MAAPPPKRTRVEQAEVAEFIERTNAEYEAVHKNFEEQFWGNKMNLAGDKYSTAELSSTKEAMEAFLREPSRLQKAENYLTLDDLSENQRLTLQLFVRTFGCYQMRDPEAVKARTATTVIEDELNSRRNAMKLGYTDNSGQFVEQSSVQLRAKMKTSADEPTRKAAWLGLRSIGDFILSNGFLDVVRGRNAMAKLLGYERAACN